MPSVTTEAMLIHLEHISRKIPVGRYGVIILAKAAWHTTKRLKKLSNITLIGLPPAYPELNSTEQVWQALRNEKLANRCYEDYHAVAGAAA